MDRHIPSWQKHICVLPTGELLPGEELVLESILHMAVEENLLVSGIHRDGETVTITPHYLNKKNVAEWYRSTKALALSEDGWLNAMQGLRAVCENNRVDAVFVLGGETALSASALTAFENAISIFIPISIQNEMSYTEYCIGLDTVLNFVLDDVEHFIPTTGAIPHKCFLISVPGAEPSPRGLSRLVEYALGMPSFVNNRGDVIQFNALRKHLEQCITREDSSKTFLIVPSCLMSDTVIEQWETLHKQYPGIDFIRHCIPHIGDSKLTGYDRMMARAIGRYSMNAFFGKKEDLAIEIVGNLFHETSLQGAATFGTGRPNWPIRTVHRQTRFLI